MFFRHTVKMAEYFYDGEETAFINTDRLRKTLKFLPTRRQVSVSAGELLNAIHAKGVEPDDVAGIFKVGAFDSSFSVQFFLFYGYS